MAWHVAGVVLGIPVLAAYVLLTLVLARADLIPFLVFAAFDIMFALDIWDEIQAIRWMVWRRLNGS